MGLFVLCMAGVAVSGLGLVADTRILDDVPLWLKPLKFSLSLGIMAVTLAALATLIPASRKMKVLMVVCSIMLAIELVFICVQAVRGVHSHFNVSSALNAAVFSTMGVSIGTFWVCLMVLWVWLWRAALADAALKVAVLWGLGVGILAMGNGWNMVGPTSEQRQEMRQDRWDYKAGSHAIGFEVPGKRIPIVGWSRTAGDLRVAHFIGMHALQLLPLLALALAAVGMPLCKRVLLTHITGMLLLAVVIGTWLQALAGMPFFGL